jgi:carboxyl-terminal processing protease
VAAALAIAVPRPAAAQSAYEQLQTLSGALNHVRLNYVDSVETGVLVSAAIAGMLGALDPHSRYVSASDLELQRAWADGRLAAVGLSLDDGDTGPVVLAVQPRSPAFKAGILPGDRVVRVNDSTIAGLRAHAVELRLIGEKGSKVRLDLERGSRLAPGTLRVTLKRQPPEARAVPPGRMADRVTGYVRLEEFSDGSPKELEKAIRDVEGRGARQLVLDLRGNPGGSVTAAVEIASLFLPKDATVLRAIGRKKTGYEDVTVRKAGDFRQLPLVVLVDGGSASASELLAGALQDHDRALVLGRRTFGKALMQTSLPLPNGDMLWLTTARIATPSGRVIQRRYQGLASAQYRAAAGQGGAADDTAGTYKTTGGRTVRAGGGIRPDVERPGVELPTWFSAAADTGVFVAVADSVALTLPADGQLPWRDTPARWDPALVVPFLARAERTLGVKTEADAPLRERLARLLAYRAAEVRWGPEAAADFQLRNDPDVQLALQQFPKLAQLLAAR